jgi:hypothetical protein
MVVRGTAGGDKVRIRVSNFYGKTPLRVGTAHIALREADSSIKAATDRTLTFSGEASIAISPGAVALSDPVALNIPPNTDIAVSLFFPEVSPEKRTIHFGSVEDAYIVSGDTTGQAKPDRARSSWVSTSPARRIAEQSWQSEIRSPMAEAFAGLHY